VIATTSDNWLGLALAVAAIVYLLCVLVFPERF
jgi:K+-transporting ATPase KdpF subunit